MNIRPKLATNRRGLYHPHHLLASLAPAGPAPETAPQAATPSLVKLHSEVDLVAAAQKHREQSLATLANLATSARRPPARRIT